MYDSISCRNMDLPVVWGRWKDLSKTTQTNVRSVRSVAILLTPAETLACLPTFCITNPKWPKWTKHGRSFSPQLLHCHSISRLRHSNAQEGDDIVRHWAACSRSLDRFNSIPNSAKARPGGFLAMAAMAWGRQSVLKFLSDGVYKQYMAQTSCPGSSGWDLMCHLVLLVCSKKQCRSLLHLADVCALSTFLSQVHTRTSWLRNSFVLSGFAVQLRNMNLQLLSPFREKIRLGWPGIKREKITQKARLLCKGNAWQSYNPPGKWHDKYTIDLWNCRTTRGKPWLINFGTCAQVQVGLCTPCTPSRTCILYIDMYTWDLYLEASVHFCYTDTNLFKSILRRPENMKTKELTVDSC